MAKFDMNRAWNDAVALVSANREVMAVVAGVFFLLPSLVLTLLFADVQAQAMLDFEQMMSGQAAGATAPPPSAGFIIAAVLGALVQVVGMMGLLALLDDAERPTVGEAIATAVRALPTLIGASLLFVLLYFVISLIFGVIVGLLGAVTGSTALVFVLLIPFLVAIVYIMIKLSLVSAVIILEKQFNPLTALTRSWKITDGNTWRLFLFYLLLLVVYLVISLVVSGVVLGGLGLVIGTGTVSMIVLGVVSALIGAAMNMLMTAILAATHRQLAGPSTGRLSETFQ